MAKKKSEDTAGAALFGGALIIGLTSDCNFGLVMGAMRMVRGYRRGIFAIIFSTVILNLLIWG
ncbi:TPA: hypothetical protein EYO57_06640 [Candidatus Poribacteria bacterium]|nr:hypothetical protein [Candidatus Poribacteria bacterium]